MLGMNYHYSIYRWQAGTAPALHVHRDMHNTWRQRQREISGRGFITTHTADNTSPSEQSYRGVLSHLSLMFSSTSLCSTRYLEKKRQKITTTIIIKHHSELNTEHHSRTQPAEYSKYSMCANTVTAYYLSDAHAVPPNSEATLGVWQHYCQTNPDILQCYTHIINQRCLKSIILYCNVMASWLPSIHTVSA